MFQRARALFSTMKSFYFFQVCLRAEFSKSCNLIGSVSARSYDLAANPGGIVVDELCIGFFKHIDIKEVEF